MLELHGLRKALVRRPHGLGSLDVMPGGSDRERYTHVVVFSEGNHLGRAVANDATWYPLIAVFLDEEDVPGPVDLGIRNRFVSHACP